MDRLLRKIGLSSAWILIFISLFGYTSACPSTVPECVCAYDSGNRLKSITCEGLNREGIPPFKETNQSVSTLAIKNSRIYKLQEGAFKGLKIRNLLLNSMNSVLVEKGALKGLEGFLESLELRGNMFQVLPDNFLYNFTALNTLSLEGNKLAYVKTSWFTNLESLQYLSFSNNDISAIETEVFTATPNLRKLHLSGNNLNYLNYDVFVALTRLSELGLADNYLSVLPENLIRGLKALTWLDLTSNRLTTIPEGFFANSRMLSQLFLGSNSLTEIKSTQLPSSNSLEALVLSNNNISTLWDSSFQSVKQLKSLLLDHNSIAAIPELGFEYLENLEVLNLQENIISELPVNNLVGLLALRELNLAGNMIEILTYGIFDPLGLLTYLDLSRNRLESIEFGPFDALRHLVYLDLRRNRLKHMETHWFRHAGALEILYMDHNRIRSIEPGSFVKLANIKTLTLDYNYIQSLDSELFSTNKDLTLLSLSHNPLKVAPLGVFGQLRKLEALNLNYTCMSSIPGGMFKNLSLLQSLHLDHSPLEMIDFYSFSGLSNLSLLSLGYHNITKIAPRSFSPFKNLIDVSLDNMGLETMDLTDILYDLPNVTQLSLTFNDLEYVDQVTFMYNANLQYLHLAGNPFVCDCRLGWLRESQIFVDAEMTTCINRTNLEKRLVTCFPLEEYCKVNTRLSHVNLCSGNMANEGIKSNKSKEEGGGDVYNNGLNFDHCVIPPEPTSPKPTVLTSTAQTTLSPVNIMVKLVENDTEIVVSWRNVRNAQVLAYRVRYRQFATNKTQTSLDLKLNETSYTIKDLVSGVNYIVCIDMKMADRYVLDDRSCEEIGSHLGRTTGSPDDPFTEVVKKKEFPWIPIVSASAAVLVVIFIIVLVIIFCLKNAKTRFSENAKKKEDRDKMVKDKMGMWVNSFNYDGNVNESMGEQLTVEFDIFSDKIKDPNAFAPPEFTSDTKTSLQPNGTQNGGHNIGLNDNIGLVNDNNVIADKTSDAGYAEPSDSDAGYGEVTESEIANDDYPSFDNTNYGSSHSFHEPRDDINETYMY